MRVFKWLIGLAVLVVAGLAIISQFLPQKIHVERTAQIDAPKAFVFNVIDDAKGFNSWSPWAKKDPNIKYTFSGPNSGVGAKMTWASDNPEVGSGTSEVIEVKENEMLKVSLDFGDHGGGTAEYLLKDAGNGTSITWAFDTDLGANPIARFMGLKMDDWVGGDYEIGLAELKKQVEAKYAETVKNEKDAENAAEEAAREAEEAESAGEEAETETTTPSLGEAAEELNRTVEETVQQVGEEVNRAAEETVQQVGEEVNRTAEEAVQQVEDEINRTTDAATEAADQAVNDVLNQATDALNNALPSTNEAETTNNQ